MCITHLLYYFSVKNEMFNEWIIKFCLRITIKLFTNLKTLFFKKFNLIFYQHINHNEKCYKVETIVDNL